jgi:hypothetical protein
MACIHIRRSLDDYRKGWIAASGWAMGAMGKRRMQARETHGVHNWKVLAFKITMKS